MKKHADLKFERKANMATLILTCSTGQGHNSCASAIKEYYEKQGEPCSIQDALSFVSPVVSKVICKGHVAMYRHFHGLFQVGYRYSEKHSAMFEEGSGIYKLLTLGTEKIKNYIVNGNYNQVICTHVFASLMMTQLQKDYHLPIHTCLVATDYTCNPGTRESDVNLHFIPDTPLSVFYECPSISDDQIVSSGIPVRQIFYEHRSKKEAKLAFGIPQNHLHLLMMCGSMGCGPMKKLARAFSKHLKNNMDLTIVCGTNHSLQKELLKKYKDHDRIHIQGYVENMSLLMDSADLYLTKPGGISVTEAAVKNLPMVFIDAVAGCEEYNKIYFIKKRAAKTGKTIHEITDICMSLLENPRMLEKMSKNLQAVASVNASQVIFNSMRHLGQETLADLA